MRQIRRDLDLSMGVLQYHLYSLEKDQRILSRRSGLYKRFYAALVFGEHQQDILDVLSQETERDLLLYLIQNPGATQKELSGYARISPGSINWHMKRLMGTHLVSVRHEGQFVKYEVKSEVGDEILHLLKGYHPSIWQSWADRLANAIGDVASSSEQENPEENEEWNGGDKSQQ